MKGKNKGDAEKLLHSFLVKKLGLKIELSHKWSKTTENTLKTSTHCTFKVSLTLAPTGIINPKETPRIEPLPTSI